MAAALSRFPAMVANSREVAWAPPAGTGKLQTQAQLRDAALAPAAPRPLRGCSRPWRGSGRARPCLLVKEEGSAVRARGASYGRGAARSVAKRLRLSNETITRAPLLRIGERGRGKSITDCLLSLFGGKWTLSCGPRAMAVENQDGLARVAMRFLN